MNSGRRKTLRPSRKDIVAPLFLFAPHELNMRENSRACSSSRKVWSVFMGSDHPEGDENRRATVGTSPVGFHDATLGATSGGGCVKEGVAGKCLEAFRSVGKPFILEGFGCTDSVRVALRSFHDVLNRASIARRTPRAFTRRVSRKIRHRRNASGPCHGPGCGLTESRIGNRRRKGNRRMRYRCVPKRKASRMNDGLDPE